MLSRFFGKNGRVFGIRKCASGILHGVKILHGEG